MRYCGVSGNPFKAEQEARPRKDKCFITLTAHDDGLMTEIG
jgi:hypothetical protein